MKSRNSRTPTQVEAARQVALGALAYLAGDPERIGPFLAESGLSPADLRGAVGSAVFHVALLDHLINHQELLIAYAGEAEIDPGHVVAAREILFHADMGED